jgi:putative membrane protein
MDVLGAFHFRSTSMKLIGFAMAMGLGVAAAAAPAAGPTDPQIAAIVVTANQVDIDAGKLAIATTHGSSPSA